MESPYAQGQPQQLLSILQRLMWRHSKSDVAEELCLPPLDIELIALKFSPVEDEYYKRLLHEQRVGFVCVRCSVI